MKAIISSQNYADEFDYPVISFFNKSDVKEIKQLIKKKKVKKNQEIEFYFGTNEALSFSTSEIIDLIDNAQKISKEELKNISNLGFSTLPALDIIDSFKAYLSEL